MMIKKTNERELILSDALICSVLRIEAEAVGVTLEEYVDRFLDCFYNDPDELYTLIKQ